MLLHSGWFLLLLSILVFWSLGAYNRLVRLRAQVAQQFGPLESVLMNYQELVHQAVTAAATAPQLWATSSELQDAWLALIHPDVYYVSVPEPLKQRWLELDVLVQPEVQRFNAAIEDYNQAIAQYPAALLAKIFQFHPATIL